MSFMSAVQTYFRSPPANFLASSPLTTIAPSVFHAFSFLSSTTSSTRQPRDAHLKPQHNDQRRKRKKLIRPLFLLDMSLVFSLSNPSGRTVAKVGSATSVTHRLVAPRRVTAHTHALDRNSLPIPAPYLVSSTGLILATWRHPTAG